MENEEPAGGRASGTEATADAKALRLKQSPASYMNGKKVSMEEVKRVRGQKIGGEDKEVGRDQIVPALKATVKGLYFLLCWKAAGE